MKAPTGSPPAYVLDDLASDWATTACHEMGHALAAFAFGVPLTRVRVSYLHDSTLEREWRVVGRTEIEDQALVNDNDSAPLVLAGLEAEARWCHQRDGGSLQRHREHVRGREVHRAGDLADLDLYLSDADFTLEQFLVPVNKLLDRYWSFVVAAAEELAEFGELHEDSVRQLLPDVGNWQMRR
jgi:hypothetical protein